MQAALFRQARISSQAFRGEEPGRTSVVSLHWPAKLGLLNAHTARAALDSAAVAQRVEVIRMSGPPRMATARGRRQLILFIRSFYAARPPPEPGRKREGRAPFFLIRLGANGPRSRPRPQGGRGWPESRAPRLPQRASRPRA